MGDPAKAKVGHHQHGTASPSADNKPSLSNSVHTSSTRETAQELKRVQPHLSEILSGDAQKYIREGSSGPAVAALKRHIQEWKASIDPSYHPDDNPSTTFTKTDVNLFKEWQKAHDLNPDGIFGFRSANGFAQERYGYRPLSNQEWQKAEQKETETNYSYRWKTETEQFCASPTSEKLGLEQKDFNKRLIELQQTEPQFIPEIERIAQGLGLTKEHLLAVMWFESKLNPGARNKASKATGLIQFIPGSAREVGTTIDELQQMSATEQLPYVEKYFKLHRQPLKDLNDCYMAVLWPRAIGKGKSHVLFNEGTKEYRQNAGLDVNRDGRITAGEATLKVARAGGIISTGQA